MKTTTDTQLDRKAVADRVGFPSVSAVDTYRARGSLPAPDGYIGRSPWWWKSTIDSWQETRRRLTPKESDEHAPATRNGSPAAP